ncbi:GNAT family N-acetyltransferase [Streptomyces sp. NBC_00237]|uniref:GNAT family N-acetyltransferase n=1 Tax=Streptomyces sp. NBC_00237 TaxID=2975687 RepID=UPI002257666E|nr:GNAT family N-acetyltransferase [Streptomyces sp. NBC_00237]MCX5207215.1 GNAT family N-acetyltransferase [Streptomyces sp. NBC_00237]
MHLDAVRELFDTEMRREAEGERLGPDFGHVVRHTGGAAGWNAVLWADLTEDTADAAIAEQVRHYTALGLDFEWKHYSHDRPEDLPQRLLAAGFVPEGPEAVMVAETEGLDVEPVLPDGVRLVEVTDKAGIDLMVRAHELAFGHDSTRIGTGVLAQLADAPDTVAVVVAMAGDEPVSAARAEFAPGTQFASLWGGGTAPEWRGKGIYRALVAHRARLAAARGYRYLQSDAVLDTSRPILQRLGFAQLSITTPYNYAPQKAG